MGETDEVRAESVSYTNEGPTKSEPEASPFGKGTSIDPQASEPTPRMPRFNSRER